MKINGQEIEATNIVITPMTTKYNKSVRVSFNSDDKLVKELDWDKAQVHVEHGDMAGAFVFGTSKPNKYVLNSTGPIKACGA